MTFRYGYFHRIYQLKGLKSYLPSPYNETIGVLHLKIYIFDKTIIISGANLNTDYLSLYHFYQIFINKHYLLK